MIIFDLDGTLADCEHRRHFVCYHHWVGKQKIGSDLSQFKPNWPAFYEACDQDKPIKAVLDAFIHLTQGKPFNHDVQIWSGRCESVREKTLKWLVNLTAYCEDYNYWDRRLKMRPIGDYTPDDVLKEKWLDEYMFAEECKHKTLKRSFPFNKVEFVFDDQPKVIRMWRRRGIFVFNCCQHDGEF